MPESFLGTFLECHKQKQQHKLAQKEFEKLKNEDTKKQESSDIDCKTSTKNGFEDNNVVCGPPLKKVKAELQLIFRDFTGELANALWQQGCRGSFDVSGTASSSIESSVPFSPLEFDPFLGTLSGVGLQQESIDTAVTEADKTSFVTHSIDQNDLLDPVKNGTNGILSSTKKNDLFSSYKLSHLLGIGTQTQRDALHHLINNPLCYENTSTSQCYMKDVPILLSPKHATFSSDIDPFLDQLFHQEKISADHISDVTLQQSVDNNSLHPVNNTKELCQNNCMKQQDIINDIFFEKPSDLFESVNKNQSITEYHKDEDMNIFDYTTHQFTNSHPLSGTHRLSLSSDLTADNSVPNESLANSPPWVSLPYDTNIVPIQDSHFNCKPLQHIVNSSKDHNINQEHTEPSLFENLSNFNKSILQEDIQKGTDCDQKHPNLLRLSTASPYTNAHHTILNQPLKTSVDVQNGSAVCMVECGWSFSNDNNIETISKSFSNHCKKQHDRHCVNSLVCPTTLDQSQVKQSLLYPDTNQTSYILPLNMKEIMSDDLSKKHQLPLKQPLDYLEKKDSVSVDKLSSLPNLKCLESRSIVSDNQYHHRLSDKSVLKLPISNQIGHIPDSPITPYHSTDIKHQVSPYRLQPSWKHLHIEHHQTNKPFDQSIKTTIPTISTVRNVSLDSKKESATLFKYSDLHHQVLNEQLLVSDSHEYPIIHDEQAVSYFDTDQRARIIDNTNSVAFDLAQSLLLQKQRLLKEFKTLQERTENQQQALLHLQDSLHLKRQLGLSLNQSDHLISHSIQKDQNIMIPSYRSTQEACNRTDISLFNKDIPKKRFRHLINDKKDTLSCSNDNRSKNSSTFYETPFIHHETTANHSAIQRDTETNQDTTRISTPIVIDNTTKKESNVKQSVNYSPLTTIGRHISFYTKKKIKEASSILDHTKDTTLKQSSVKHSNHIPINLQTTSKTNKIQSFHTHEIPSKVEESVKNTPSKQQHTNETQLYGFQSHIKESPIHIDLKTPTTTHFNTHKKDIIGNGITKKIKDKLKFSGVKSILHQSSNMKSTKSSFYPNELTKKQEVVSNHLYPTTPIPLRTTHYHIDKNALDQTIPYRSQKITSSVNSHPQSSSSIQRDPIISCIPNNNHFFHHDSNRIKTPPTPLLELPNVRILSGIPSDSRRNFRHSGQTTFRDTERRPWDHFEKNDIDQHLAKSGRSSHLSIRQHHNDQEIDMKSSRLCQQHKTILSKNEHNSFLTEKLLSQKKLSNLNDNSNERRLKKTMLNTRSTLSPQPPSLKKTCHLY